jgi:hypothetical protein
MTCLEKTASKKTGSPIGSPFSLISKSVMSFLGELSRPPKRNARLLARTTAIPYRASRLRWSELPPRTESTSGVAVTPQNTDTDRQTRSSQETHHSTEGPKERPLRRSTQLEKSEAPS